MRNLAIALATTAALVASPAMARDGAWYIGGEFGASIVEDIDFDVGAVEDAITVDHDYGYDGGLFVGYDLGGFRLEAEAAYKKADLEEYDSAISLPGFAAATVPGLRDAGGGSTTVMSFMINGMLDFGDDDGISGFVGGGAGLAKTKANNYRAFSNQAPFLDDSDSGLAWQVFAGVRQAISDNADVTLKYRFFNAPGVNYVAFNGAETDSRYRSHSLLGGITFNFGGAEPPPPPPVPAPVRAAPPPPPPPPPPPVQLQTCPNGQRIPVTQACPVPPAPEVPRTGERG